VGFREYHAALLAARETLKLGGGKVVEDPIALQMLSDFCLCIRGLGFRV
jgi:hypothetical protein